MSFDLALTEHPSRRDKLIAHRPDCSQVVKAREKGQPVITMLGCEGGFPRNIPACKCLRRDRR